MRARAYAKVNIGLRVGSRRPDGYHPLQGLFQSIGWFDLVHLDGADEDIAEAAGGGELMEGRANLAWRAAVAVRDRAGTDRRMRLALAKDIPAAAGLGGGSADAAATLGLAGRFFSVAEGELEKLAPGLGSDVPFCLRGGLALVEGRGEVLHPRTFASGYALGIVVPPIELATPAVYARWDSLGEPRGEEIPAAALPPALRGEAPPGNDLYPAAVAIGPTLDDWRAELAARWGRPVLMSGSGPSLYAFFLDRSEAEEAVASSPAGARDARAVAPVARGWEIIDGDAGE
jgi:4-diphosphocytidyl-2-C-methyl-D-erythritol kinase